MTAKLREMPLFPLNTVLFPGMVLPLHIFEPRYKQMIGECVRTNEPFGIVLIKDGPEVGGQAQPYSIGTSAYVTHIQQFEDGRMNIQTVGYQRFKIHDLQHNQPYLVGLVEDYPIQETDGPEIEGLLTQFGPAFRNYLQRLVDATDLQFEMSELPADGLALAILAAITLPLPIEEKQMLLQSERLADIIQNENRLLRRETILLDHLLQERDDEADVPFSVN